MSGKKVVQYVVLSEKCYVTKQFYDGVRAIVSVAAQRIESGESSTARALCGKDFWSALSKAERIAAGRCVSHMVDRQLVELDFAVCPFAHPKRYVRRGDSSACFAKCSRFPR